MKDLNAEIWLPHFWFFLYSTAHNYPDFPNKVIKRKYYDFVSNIPLFCPNVSIKKKLIELLDYFPVTPYLDNRDSFTYLIHIIQKKLHKEIGMEEKQYFQHLDEYYNSYLPKQYKLSEKLGIQKRHIIFALLFILACFIIYYTQ